MVRAAQGRDIEPDLAEKQWLGRLALVLMILVPVVAITAGDGDGAALGFLFWIGGMALGVATRRTLAGRVAVWMGLGIVALICATVYAIRFSGH